MKGLFMKSLKKILIVIGCGINLLTFSACSGGYNSSESCVLDNKSPAKKLVTTNGTEQYYCKDCISKCAFCDKKATKNYTTLLDFHVFVCNEHYKEVSE